MMALLLSFYDGFVIVVVVQALCTSATALEDLQSQAGLKRLQVRIAQVWKEVVSLYSFWNNLAIQG